jgi:uncharacterized SAM-binding protein YcdF (DUF218 family)
VKRSTPSRARRLATRTLLVLLATTLVVGAWSWPRAGRYLVVDTPLQAADAIVVLAGARAERWLEGVELYKENVAPTIVLSTGRVERAEQLLRQRGIRFPSETEIVKDAMVQMGVPAERVLTFPDRVDNTAAEAELTRAMAAARGWRSLIVVTSKYHTRRSLYAFQRAFSGTGITIQVRGTRFDEAQPDTWWKHRGDLRFVISEWQKLIAYRLGLEG